MLSRSFPRTLSSLPAIFRFLDEKLAPRSPDSEAKGDIRLAVDELFTNMVEHQPGGGREIEIVFEERDDRVIIRLVDREVDRFDVTSVPEPDLELAPESRPLGGLGIFLTRQLMNEIHYEYDEHDRTSTITLEKVLEA